MFKVNDNAKHRFGVFIVLFIIEHVSNLALVFLLLTFNM